MSQETTDFSPPETTRTPFRRWDGTTASEGLDSVVVEEPIEFRIADDPIATVMRTPGDDRDLALGFLFAEGWIERPEDVGSLCLCHTAIPEDPRGDVAGPNTANLIPARTLRSRPGRAGGLVTSSCGVCGKERIADVLSTLPPLDSAESDADRWELSLEMLGALPEALRRRQPVFDQTGALHAAGVFERDGTTLVVREDVGRHNAVDKVVGCLFRGERLPLDQQILVVSGRISFEIIQKAARARIRCVVSVSGVSSLAIELAEAAGITLCGFARDGSFSCYSRPGRLCWPQSRS